MCKLLLFLLLQLLLGVLVLVAAAKSFCNFGSYVDPGSAVAVLIAAIVELLLALSNNSTLARHLLGYACTCYA